MAQVWAVNETMAVITGTTQMQTLDIFLESIEKTFGDPDRARMACAQLHELKMTPGTTAEDYTARFKMLMGRTSFNETTLEDIYIRGLPNSLTAWKMVVRNLDRLHWSLTELKRSTSQTNLSVGRTSQMVGQAKPQAATTTSQSTHITVNPQASDSTTPMVVNLQKA